MSALELCSSAAQDALKAAPSGLDEEAANESAEMQVKKVSQAAAQFTHSGDGAPNSVDDLVGRRYIKEADKKDPWGNELTMEPYDSPDQPVRVCSLGPDGKSGGADDICYPQKQ